MPSDTELLFEMIVALARYERAPELVVGSPELLSEALFGPDPSAEAILAEIDGTPVGFALFYRTFSTWQCRPGIWLEDLFVRPAFRGRGHGLALLQALRSRTDGRVEWAVLDWNEPAIEFYKSLGAAPMDDWTVYRLTGDALAKLAGA